MALLVSEVLTQMRGVYLNDRNSDRFSDDDLIPYIQEASQFLQSELLAHELKVVEEESSVITVPPGDSNLSLLAGYPDNLVNVLEIFERLPGDSDNDWMRLTESSNLQGEAGNYAYNWSFSGGVVKIRPANRELEIYLKYYKILTDISGPNSPLWALHIKGYLASRAAAMAAAFNGNNSVRAQAIGAISEQYKDNLLAIEVKEQQDEPVRHKPYSIGIR